MMSGCSNEAQSSSSASENSTQGKCSTGHLCAILHNSPIAAEVVGAVPVLMGM